MKSVVVAILAFLWIVPFSASARSARQSTYRYSQIWNTAVRFVRIDNGFDIVEKDRDSGYLLFSYTEGDKRHSGSVELIRTSRDSHTGVTIGIGIQSMPSYVEKMLLDKLERKLRDEYGDPPQSGAVDSGGEQDGVEKANTPSADDNKDEGATPGDKIQ